MIIFGLVTLNKSNSDLRHGRYTNNLPRCLETDYFFSTSSRKNYQFQDFTRADYLVQRPAFGHYLINTHPKMKGKIHQTTLWIG